MYIWYMDRRPIQCDYQKYLGIEIKAQVLSPAEGYQ